MDFKFKKDKQGHFIAGFVIALVVSIASSPMIGLSSAILAGLIMASLAGIVKEVKDFFFGGTVEFADFVYTALGGFLCFAILITAIIIFERV